jgi:hypothetical protein
MDLSKLRAALVFTHKDRPTPNLTLDVRIEVRAVDKPEVGLLWKVSAPGGGYGRTTNESSAVLAVIGLRLAEMERAVRRQIAGQAAVADEEEPGDTAVE